MEVFAVRHRWPEKADFVLERKNGTDDFVFLHFISEAVLLCEDRSLSLAAGSVIVLAPHTPHTIKAKGPLLHDWMHLTGNVQEQMQEFGLETNQVYPAGGEALTLLMAELEREFFANRSFRKQSLDILLSRVLLYMARAVQPAERTASLPAADVQERLHAFREYMLIHTEMDWSVERMAGSVHLSAPRFYVVYRNLFGVTPMLDLRYARAERAKALLLSGQYTVTEVAELAGYANVYQFIRSFRQLTGMTPGSYAAQR